MRFSENEVETLVRVMGSESTLYPKDLSQDFRLRPETVSRTTTRLREKGLLEREDHRIVLAEAVPAESFKKLYYAHRASPFQLILADRRVDLLYSLDQNPKSIETLSNESGIPSKTIYYYLKDLIRLGIVRKTKIDRGYLYSFNYLFWGALKDFVTSLQEYRPRRLVPRDALLIKSNKDEVLFKSIRLQDATNTSFSAYRDYGVELGLLDNYYTLPKRELSIKEVFIHSLDSAEVLQLRLFCILFYLKNRDKLEGAEHPMIKDIQAVLRGERIKGYPSLEDIKDRAELYDIEIEL
jgi:predicted transcriptional regulator